MVHYQHTKQIIENQGIEKAITHYNYLKSNLQDCINHQKLQKERCMY